MIYTVFFDDANEAPQDFETNIEAVEFAESRNCGGYTIATTNGEIE